MSSHHQLAPGPHLADPQPYNGRVPRFPVGQLHCTLYTIDRSPHRVRMVGKPSTDRIGAASAQAMAVSKSCPLGISGTSRLRLVFHVLPPILRALHTSLS
jgi:hypothetical protein